MRKWLVAALTLSLLLTAGCGHSDVTNTPQDNAEQTQSATVQTDETMFTDRDQEQKYEVPGSVRIELQGDAVSASSSSVHIDTAHAEGKIVTITQDGTYLISGTLNQGMIIVDAGEKAKPQLVLDGATIHSTSMALEIREADKVFVTLAQNTENVLFGTDGTISSKEDLTLNGSGSLTVSASAGHGITCKDDLVITGGSYQINSASHGLDANDSVRITGDTAITLTAGKDGIHCENSEDTEKGFVYIEEGNFKITAEGDGISSGANARILGGSFEILAGGGNTNGTKEHSDFFGGFGGGGRPVRPRGPQSDTTATTEDSSSMKGIKAAGDILIAAGNLVLDTADDCIHSNASITVSGGILELSSGDDGLHADDTLTVETAMLNIKTSYEGLEAHKIYVRNGTLEIHAKDDGINAAGGQDSSGTSGGRDGMFGGRPGGPFGGGSSDGIIDISGGDLKIYSSGDGMDANGSITISGGDLYVTNPSAGDTSVLDSDNGAVITGGTFISAGASTMMAQSFTSASTQGVIACTVGSEKAGTQVTVQDADGNTLISYETEYDFVLVIISNPELQKGQTYTLTIGQNTDTIQAN